MFLIDEYIRQNVPNPGISISYSKHGVGAGTPIDITYDDNIVCIVGTSLLIRTNGAQAFQMSTNVGVIIDVPVTGTIQENVGFWFYIWDSNRVFLSCNNANVSFDLQYQIISRNQKPVRNQND